MCPITTPIAAPAPIHATSDWRAVAAGSGLSSSSSSSGLLQRAGLALPDRITHRLEPLGGGLYRRVR